MRGYAHRSDSLMATATAEIKAQLAKAKRPVNGIEFYDLYSRVRVDLDGRLALEMPELVHADRVPSGFPHHPWLEFRVRVLPLVEGVRLYLSAESPHVELLRRQHVLAEEDRQREVRSLANTIAAAAARQKAAEDGVRNQAWRLVPIEQRCKLVRGPFADVDAYIDALVAEKSNPSLPPASWKPETIEVQEPGPIAMQPQTSSPPTMNYGQRPLVNPAAGPGTITSDNE